MHPTDLAAPPADRLDAPAGSLRLDLEVTDPEFADPLTSLPDGRARNDFAGSKSITADRRPTIPDH